MLESLWLSIWGLFVWSCIGGVNIKLGLMLLVMLWSC